MPPQDAASSCWLGASSKCIKPQIPLKCTPSCLTLSQVLDPEVEHTHVDAVQNEHGGAKYGHTNQVIQLICAELAPCFAATSRCLDEGVQRQHCSDRKGCEYGLQATGVGRSEGLLHLTGAKDAKMCT